MATKSIRRVKNQPNATLLELEKDIIEHASEYDFFQAYRLLESVNDAYPVSPRRPKRKIQVRPSLSLAYNNNDVHSVQQLDKHQGYEIVTQISGLYGVSSPLPDSYNEELLDNEWDELNAPREFLDIIHRQLFPKLYSAWRLYRVNLNTIERNQSSYWSILYNLLGLPDDSETLNSAHGDAYERVKQLKIRYFSLFSNQERSASGLKLILSDYIDESDISVTEFDHESVTISPQLRCRLGVANSQLGQAHIGSKIQSQLHRITITVANIEEDKYNALFSDPFWVDCLKLLVAHYISRPLKVDLKLQVLSSDYRTQLGGQWNQLGKTSVLGKTNDLHHSISMNLLE
ncbi:type VI secretion system baseplate subunit TssG [Bermanella marisrubri]|uniref:Type VI secretion system baseplate subunit TssG n=1 Tax=Bermanella marisrubri TaxID=207949 RepID=Q1N518_9GAMM|nr:type VI secretion system baseplate subunit TssG [Bermanella marisrubri]EAT13260.1 hypothetical protein RED65_00830 [Oceanobacter sp. RED65] [Bermanella marisrubri]QIZ84027.1 type VI secretion system baseplate subunit TssG [Bermanella marisrubri]